MIETDVLKKSCLFYHILTKKPFQTHYKCSAKPPPNIVMTHFQNSALNNNLYASWHPVSSTCFCFHIYEYFRIHDAIYHLLWTRTLWIIPKHNSSFWMGSFKYNFFINEKCERWTFDTSLHVAYQPKKSLNYLNDWNAVENNL